MDPVKELIDEETLQKGMLMLIWIGPVVGVVLGALIAACKKQRLSIGLGRGFIGGLLGPFAYLLWRWFDWITRYQPAPDPKNDYFGLERVDVLLLNVVIFVVVGAALGYLVRWVRARDARRLAAESASSESEPTPPTTNTVTDQTS